MSQIDMTHAQHQSSVADLVIPGGCIAAIAAVWRAFTNWPFDDYRPEKHYMRGPGPKWREKHSLLTMNVANRRMRVVIVLTATE
jgi:hypothetical protein